MPQLNVPVSPEVMMRAKVAAVRAGMTLRAWVEMIIMRVTEEKRKNA